MQYVQTHMIYTRLQDTHRHINAQSNKPSKPLHNTTPTHMAQRKRQPSHKHMFTSRRHQRYTKDRHSSVHKTPLLVRCNYFLYIYLTAGDVLRRNRAWDDAADLLPFAVTLLLAPLLWQGGSVRRLFVLLSSGRRKFRSPPDAGLGSSVPVCFLILVLLLSVWWW